MSTGEFATLRVSGDGPVGRLTLARPERLNALSFEVLDELVAAATWFDARPEVRSVVVAGEGRAFCAGYDISEDPAAVLASEGKLSWEERRDAADLGRRMADAVEGMRAVTVAALHGHVVGGGVVLAAACDLRLAAHGTRFSIPEVDMGIPLAWGGIPRLVREIGPARTRELVMTCRPFDAAEAHAIGFVNRVVPAADLAEAAADLAETIAAKPAVPIQATKQQVQAASGTAAYAFGDADALLAALASPESRAAAAAYRRSILGG